MPLKQKDIDKLKKIHFEETGETLSDQEAWQMGIDLLEIGKLLLRIYKYKTSCRDDRKF